MYHVVRCPKCGAIQATSSLSSMQCKSCGARSTMRGEAQWKVEVLAEAADGRTAGWLVRKFKMMGATGGKA